MIVRTDAIVLHAFGRSCLGYKSAAETDSYEAVAAATFFAVLAGVVVVGRRRSARRARDVDANRRCIEEIDEPCHAHMTTT